MKKTKVIIGMSGGVDSSAAAFILKNEGYEVLGVTLMLTPDAADSCADAQKVAEKIGIEHKTVDLRERFQRSVIDYFINEYLSGATPNPCVICNREIKFGALREIAASENAELVATGHYAVLDKKKERCLLKKAPSPKDQSYFLSRLSQEQLRAALFPLGNLNKDEIRAMAQASGIPTANKPDSQEICFIKDNDYAGFICRSRNYIPQSGNFIDSSGKVIGEHRGIIHYTVGQRKGLGAFGQPMFVTGINAVKNEVVLGVQGEQLSDMVRVSDMNWIAFETPPEFFRAQVKIRYRAKPAWAEIMVDSHDGTVTVKLDEPQKSVTPGQTAAFYDGDTVLGGGRIL